MRKQTTILIAAMVFASGGLASAFALFSPRHSNDLQNPQAIWRETSWPFPMDQWGTGKAFGCSAADCGAEIAVYLRAKVGFCNCSGGMTTDEEIDRIADFDLFGSALYPQAAGVPVRAAWMNGRARPFAVRDSRQRDFTALTIGLHDHCDALVATAALPRGALSVAEPAIRRFLDSKIFRDWAETTLGL